MRGLNGLTAGVVVLALWPSLCEPRSPAARADFQRLHPCPATDKSRGPCPGWQVDHITPLKCGGPDAPHNMQWLTVEQHKIKSAREAKHCRQKSVN
jgi:hypothetical protein